MKQKTREAIKKGEIVIYERRPWEVLAAYETEKGERYLDLKNLMLGHCNSRLIDESSCERAQQY